MIPPIRRRQLVHKRGILRNQPVLFETFREEFEVVTILYRSAKLFPFVMWLFIVLSLNTLLSFHLWQAEAKLKDGDCEVCIKFLTNFAGKLSSDDLSDLTKIQDKLKATCKKAKTKENRFCYYIGGTADAATGMLKEVVKPLSYHMPADKICEKLKKQDAQICELQYDKQIDLNNVDLKKLRVKQLKKILSDWDEDCVGCLEKSDFIKKIEMLKKEHTEL